MMTQPNNANQTSPKKVSIRLEEAENGWTLSGFCHSEDDSLSCGRDLQYVYKTLDEALKEVPGFVSVLKGADKGTMKAMADDQMMAKANKGMKGGMND